MASSYCRSDNWDDDWDEDAEPPALPQLSALKVPAAAAAPADKFAGEDEGVDEPNHAVPQTQKVRSRHHIGCSALLSYGRYRLMLVFTSLHHLSCLCANAPRRLSQARQLGNERWTTQYIRVCHHMAGTSGCSALQIVLRWNALN